MSNRVFEQADAFPLSRYINALGKHYSDDLAACCALAEALSEVISPFAMSARQTAEYVYGDREKFHAAGSLIFELCDIGFLTKCTKGDPDNRVASCYRITDRAMGELR